MNRFEQDGRLLDGAAAALSSLCLLHCLLLPLGLTVLPMISASFGEALHGPEWLHWALMAIAAPVSARALWRGMEVHHGWWPSILALIGFVTMVVGALAHGYEAVEAALTLVGGAIVAAAHWMNWKARQA